MVSDRRKTKFFAVRLYRKNRFFLVFYPHLLDNRSIFRVESAPSRVASFTFLGKKFRLRGVGRVTSSRQGCNRRLEATLSF